MSGIEITETGAARAVAHLRELGVRAEDVQPAQGEVRLVFAAGERKRFDEQGPGWPHLAEATSERKKAQGLDPRILRASERLYNSLVDPGSSDAVSYSTPGSIELGTKVFYARFHQHGTAKMPQRIVVEVTQTEQAEMAAILSNWIAHGEGLP